MKKIKNDCGRPKKGKSCAVEIVLPHSITDKAIQGKASK